MTDRRPVYLYRRGMKYRIDGDAPGAWRFGFNIFTGNTLGRLYGPDRRRVYRVVEFALDPDNPAVQIDPKTRRPLYGEDCEVVKPLPRERYEELARRLGDGWFIHAGRRFVFEGGKIVSDEPATNHPMGVVRQA